MEIENQYPIGQMEEIDFSSEAKNIFLNEIQFLPDALEAAISNLDEEQLQTPYRQGGWTVHQLVHHIADSHMNALERFKLGYTENVPTIKPYDEAAWAELNDVKELPVNISITLLYALHRRWYTFLKGLKDEDWQRKVFHPEYKRELTLWHYLQVYAWHGRHHVAQINYLRDKMRW